MFRVQTGAMVQYSKWWRGVGAAAEQVGAAAAAGDSAGTRFPPFFFLFLFLRRRGLFASFWTRWITKSSFYRLQRVDVI